MKKHKITIVEDDEHLVKLISDVLSSKYDVRLALPTEEDQAHIAKDQPSVILLDIVLPGQSGFDFLKKLKMNQTTKDIPVVILSNLGQDAEVRRAQELGAVDYIVKADHSIDEIMKKIETIIKNHGNKKRKSK